MSAVDRETLTVLAGEYVLGMLRDRAREEFQSHCAKNPKTAAICQAWEACFEPLTSLFTPVKPPDSLWFRLENDLGLAPFSAKDGDLSGQDRNIALRNRFQGWWKGGVILGMALAVALAGVFFFRSSIAPRPSKPPAVAEKPMPSAPTPEVSSRMGPLLTAIMLNDAQEPWCVIRESAPGGKLFLTLMRPMPEDGDDRELWLFGANNIPQSLGLISQKGLIVEPAPQVVSDRVLVVSLEAKGGSLKGRPTGKILATGKLSRVQE